MFRKKYEKLKQKAIETITKSLFYDYCQMYKRAKSIFFQSFFIMADVVLSVMIKSEKCLKNFSFKFLHY
jgi:hypothetical protein